LAFYVFNIITITRKSFLTFTKIQTSSVIAVLQNEQISVFFTPYLASRQEETFPEPRLTWKLLITILADAIFDAIT
jgi:hypothetical protein